MKQLPEGFAYESPERVSANVEFLSDLTWIDRSGIRHVEQQIFDEVFSTIERARRFILLDMFLYNSFQGRKPEMTRALSAELTDKLIAQKQAHPDIRIVVITDPINTVYGGIASTHFDALTRHDIELVITDLDRLPDSNPCYSLPWRVLVKPFGSPEGSLMPNPFGDGRVAVRSWLKLLNFKANHRKTLVADAGQSVVGLVTSANPHDGSSAHGNTAIKFTGQAAMDLLESELPVFKLADLAVPQFDTRELAIEEPDGDFVVSVVTEARIKETTLQLLNRAGAGDTISLVMFYLSDRQIIGALIQAQDRGADLRILLDPNKDAFGWNKNGIPNRQTASELVQRGIPVRWCDTHGEQCHSKMLIVEYQDSLTHILTGSANYTRRNLENFNLETDAWVRTGRDRQPARDARAYFDLLWHNDADRHFSVDYSVYESNSFIKRAVYRFQEATGFSSF